MLSRVFSPSAWRNLFRALSKVNQIEPLQQQLAEQAERIQQLEAALRGNPDASQVGLQARVDHCELALQNLQPRVDKSEIQQRQWAEQMLSRESAEAMVAAQASKLIHYQIQSVQQRLDQQLFDGDVAQRNEKTESLESVTKKRDDAS